MGGWRTFRLKDATETILLWPLGRRNLPPEVWGKTSSPPTSGRRVGHLGGLTSPFSPSSHFEIAGGRGWATAGPERGYPEPFVLLEPPAQNPGRCGVVRSVFLVLRVLNPDAPKTSWTALDPPWTPLKPPGPSPVRPPCPPSNPGFAKS